MFLAFQYPQQVQGVSVINFLRQALSARKGIDLSVLELRLSIMEWMERLDMDPSFADRFLNEGFSGGEKKRNEILQMAILEPEIAILDETDSGLDIDALKVVAQGVQEVRRDRPELGVLAITHYQRLLDHLEPDVVHILIDGRIVDSGGPELAPSASSASGVRGDSRDEPTLTGPSTSPPSRRTSRSSSARCTAAASSTSTPPTPRRSRRAVLDAMAGYYEHSNANVHRGTYLIAEEATAALEGARAKVARFIGAPSVARGRVHQERHRGAQPGGQGLGAGQPRAPATPSCSPSSSTTPTSCRGTSSHDELGVELRWIPVGADGHLDLTDLDRLVDGAKVVSFAAMSNVLGTLLPVERLVDGRPRRRGHRRHRRLASTSPTSPPTCRPGAPTSPPSPATRCAAPPASACSGAPARSSRPRRRSSPAAR